jgi:hypothetical protein
VRGKTEAMEVGGTMGTGGGRQQEEQEEKL